jgi:hypothetical protein
MELEAEETWLRKRVVRLRTALRYANDPRVEVILREVIGDAENRLEVLQANRGRPVQQQQQVQPRKRRLRRPPVNGLTVHGAEPKPVPNG